MRKGENFGDFPFKNAFLPAMRVVHAVYEPRTPHILPAVHCAFDRASSVGKKI